METTVVIMFKNGKQIRMKCDNFVVKKNGFEQLTNIEWEGAKNINILHIDFAEIMCIYYEFGKNEEEE